MAIIIPIRVDTDGANKELQAWADKQRQKALSIDVDIDSAPFDDAIARTLSLGRALDDLKSPPSIEVLKQRASEAGTALAKARQDAEAFASSIAHVDASADSEWAVAYSSRLNELNQVLAEASRGSQQAAAAIEASETAAKNNATAIDTLNKMIRELGAANLSEINTSIDALEQGVKSAKAEFERATQAAREFAQSQQGIDFSQMDPSRVREITEEMERLEAKTNEAGQALRIAQQALDTGHSNRNQLELLATEKIEKVKGVYNDLRDVFDITSVSLLGFSEAEKQTASEAAYMAEKAAAVGLGIGGLPGLLVAAGIGLMGVAHWNTEAAKRMEELNKQLREGQDQFRATYAVAKMFGAQSFDFGAAAKGIDQQAEALKRMRAELPDDAELARLRNVYIAQQENAKARGVQGVQADDWKDDKLKKYEQYQEEMKKLNDATVAYYDMVLAQSGEADTAISRQIEGWAYLGKQRPMALIDRDIKEATDKMLDMGASTGELEKKLQEMQNAKGMDGWEGVLERIRVELAYNIDLDKDYVKVQQEVMLAHQAQGSIVSWLTSLYTEQNTVTEAGIAKDKAATEAAKSKYEAMVAPIKDAQRQVEELGKIQRKYSEEGQRAGELEEKFQAARAGRKLSPELEKQLRKDTEAAYDAEKNLETYKQKIGETKQRTEEAAKAAEEAAKAKATFFADMGRDIEDQQKLVAAMVKGSEEYEFQSRYIAAYNQAVATKGEVTDEDTKKIEENVRAQIAANKAIEGMKSSNAAGEDFSKKLLALDQEIADKKQLLSMSGLTAGALSIEAQIQSAINAAKEKGKELSASEIQDLRDKLTMAQNYSQQLDNSATIKEVNKELAKQHLSLEGFLKISSLSGVGDITKLTAEQLAQLADEANEFAGMDGIDQWAQRAAASFGKVGESADLMRSVFGSVGHEMQAIGNQLADGIGGAVSGVVNEMLEARTKNEKAQESFGKSMGRATADFLRSTGSQLIGDGMANELKAIAMAFSPTPGARVAAAGLAAAGAAEIAAGLAMGGVGIGIGRKVGAAPGASGGDGDSATSSSSGGSHEDPGPTVLPPVIIDLDSASPYSALVPSTSGAPGPHAMEPPSFAPMTDILKKIHDELTQTRIEAMDWYRKDEAWRAPIDVPSIPSFSRGDFDNSFGGRHFDPGPSATPQITNNFNGPILSDGHDARIQIGQYVNDSLDAYHNAGPKLNGG